MQQVTQSNLDGRNVWEFEANNTHYTVIEETHGGYCVWSQRNSLRNPTINVYDSLEQMGERSKALKNLAVLIAA